MLRLVLPDTKIWDSYIEALKEGYNYSSNTPKLAEEISAIEADPFTYLEGENIQTGFFKPDYGIKRPRVAHNKYWFIEDDIFIGSIWLRYSLNDYLEKYVGHIGYGIRPNMRRMGYAGKMLFMGLSKIKLCGVHKVMLTADEDNIASCKMIESKGGKQTGVTDSVFKEGNKTRVYWIDLKGDI